MTAVQRRPLPNRIDAPGTSVEALGRQVVTFSTQLVNFLRGLGLEVDDLEASSGSVDFGSPVGLTPGGSNVDGVSPDVAHADHEHALPAFGSTSGTFLEGDTKLDDLSAPDDNTDLNATTGHHGLAPKGDSDTTKFWRADWSLATPSGTAAGFPSTISSSTSVAANTSVVVSGPIEINAGVSLEIGSGGRLEVLGPAWVPGSTWWPDTAPINPSAWDDEFNGTSLSGNWSTWDPGGILIRSPSLDGRGNMLLTAPTGTVLKWAGAYRAVPTSSEYTIYVKCTVSGSFNTGLRGGMALAQDVVTNPTTSDIMLQEVVPGTTGGAVYQLWTDYQSFSTTYGTVNLNTFIYYMRARVYGAVIAYDFSMDGQSWLFLATVTSAFTPKQVVLLIANQNTSFDAYVRYDFYRVFSFPGCSGFDATHIGGRL